MNKAMSAIAVVFLLLAVGVMGYWAMDGKHMANQFEVEKVTYVEDEFGDKEKRSTWVKEFHLGLMDGALPASLVCLGLSAGLGFAAWRGKKKSDA